MDYVIGCDVGSQSTKAVLVSYEGSLCGDAAEAYPIDYPQPLWAEQSAEHWTRALKLAVRRLLAETGVCASQVRGIGVASQVETVVPIDRRGQPLRSAILWMDRRATAQCETLRGGMGAEAVLELTGLNIDPSHVAPKIQWIAQHQPDLYERTAYFLQTGSYIAFQLAGELAVDYSNASATLLLDIQNKKWSPAMCAAFQIEAGHLPPVCAATELIGTLRGSIAEELGLNAQTRVVVGSGDEHAACLGAGVVQPGLVGDIVGTSEPVCAASATLLIDPSGLLETHCHAHPDLWLLENPGFVSGGNLRWFRDQFGQVEVARAAQTQARAYELLDAGAEQVPPGAEGVVFLPCLMGATTPTWNAEARGTFFGFTLAHTRAHFTRAILEGSAYAVRDLTERMAALGLRVDELRVMGGGSQSRLWNQIKADVTGLPVAVPATPETAALGAALLALVGLNVYATPEEACVAAVKIRERYEPQPEHRAIYDDSYALYRQVYFSLFPAFKQAGRGRA